MNDGYKYHIDIEDHGDNADGDSMVWESSIQRSSPHPVGPEVTAQEYFRIAGLLRNLASKYERLALSGTAEVAEA